MCGIHWTFLKSLLSQFQTRKDLLVFLLFSFFKIPLAYGFLDLLCYTGYGRRFILFIPSFGPRLWSDNGVLLHPQRLLYRILARRKIKTDFLQWVIFVYLFDCNSSIHWLWTYWMGFFLLWTSRTSGYWWRTSRNWSQLYSVGFLEFMIVYTVVYSFVYALFFFILFI